jgi:hypothetical protein
MEKEKEPEKPVTYTNEFVVNAIRWALSKAIKETYERETNGVKLSTW